MMMLRFMHRMLRVMHGMINKNKTHQKIVKKLAIKMMTITLTVYPAV